MKEAKLDVADQPKHDDHTQKNPEESAGILNLLSFWFVNRLVTTGFKRPLTVADFWPIAHSDKCTTAGSKLNELWQKEKEKKGAQASLFKCTFRFFAWETLWIGLLTAIARAGDLAQPTILGKFLEWFLNPFANDWEGYVWVAVFFGIPFFSAIATTRSQQIATRGVVRLRAGLASLVYDKALRVSSTSNIALPERQSKKKKKKAPKNADKTAEKDKEHGEKDGDKKEGDGDKKEAAKDTKAVPGAKSGQESTTGRIVNLMSTDAEKVGLMMMMMPNSLITPIQVAVNLALIYDLMQGATFAGFGGMLLCVPFMIVSLRWVAMYSAKQALLTDSRLKTINEILQGIRMVKFFAWEPSFLKKIDNVRRQELKEIFRVTASFQLFTLIFNVIPLTIPLCTFGAYLYFIGPLNVVSMFKSLAYFQSIQIPLVMVPISLSSVGTGFVSARRLQAFLDLPELDPKLVTRQASDPEFPIVVKGSFAYEKAAPAPSTEKKGKAAKAEEKEKRKGKVDMPAEEKEIIEVKPFQLSDVHFRARKGKLTAVIGSVGSGKSTLLNAILGEMRPVPDSDFAVVCAEQTGYVAQKAWIQSMTIKNNILFGREFVEERYKACIRVCALEPDFATLPFGDKTEIGDRGINLSGGQKQRIALARAVYSGAPAYLFDDPLSAVDANVGDHIMKKCFTGALAGKTRVLIMNQLHFLPLCDYVYLLENGRIVAEGTFADLNSKNENFKKLVVEHASALSTVAKSDQKEGEVIAPALGGPASPGSELRPGEKAADPLAIKSDEPLSPSGAIFDQPSPTPAASILMASAEEPRNSISVVAAPKAEEPVGALVPVANLLASGGNADDTSLGPLAPLLPIGVSADKQDEKQIEEEEIQSGRIGAGGYKTHVSAMGTFLFFLFCLTGGIAQAGQSLSTFVLSWWTADKFHHPGDPWWYLGLMALVGLAGAVFVFIRGMIFSIGTYVACRQYHSRLVVKTLHAPSTFYDVTPVGRVLNRFSKDMNDIDSMLPRTMQGAINLLFMLVGSLISTSIETPYFLIVIGVTGIGFFGLQRYFSRSTIQLKRIESVSRSPVYNHFSETLLGLATIRAFNATDRFQYIKVQRINQMTQSYFLLRCVLNWASLRIGMINSILISFAVLFVVIDKGVLDPGSAALAIYFVLGISPLLGFLVVNMTELDNQMNAVERVNYYCDNLEQEASWSEDQVSVPADWPAQGKIGMKDVVFRYRKNLDPVLHGLSCDIEGVEKIGVAGRTGSGKSSLMLCLFRMYEIDSGTINVDGVDISKIGLHTLRRKLAIIPQDPVVFSGTVRENLDPFGAYPDEAVWEALEQCQLGTLVKSLGGLQAAVKEYGENLSVGQRQLLCIARAVLRKPKILVMDEATSSVDSGTDTLVQKMVRTAFKDATTVTIAHRLNTIMDCDRVLVLSNGRMVEFDTPERLVAHEGGVFAGMHQALTHHH